MAPLRRKDPKVKQRDVNIWVVALAGGHWRELCFTFLGMALCALLVAAHFISSKEKL